MRASKEHIDLATKAAGLIVWTWDIPRDDVWLSSKDRAHLGFSEGEKLTAERILSVVHPEDRQLVRLAKRRCAENGQPEIENQYRVLLPDGRVRLGHEAWPHRVRRSTAINVKGVRVDFNGHQQGEARRTGGGPSAP